MSLLLPSMSTLATVLEGAARDPDGPLVQEPATALALILTLGVLAQWLAHRLRLPSILVLLITGLLVGPTFEVIDVEALFGPLLFPIVGLAVATILFEGGLSLRREELTEIGPALTRLIGIGIPVTWVLSSVAARYLLGFDWPLAVILGAILVVTGPTVTLPLLSHIRPKGRMSALLKWEGIVNDPIGAILAVLVLEWVVESGVEGATGDAVLGILRAAAIGVGIGWITTELIAVALRRHLVPDSLQSSLALGAALLSFVISNELQHESGLLTVTVLGILLTNKRHLELEHVVEFKENLRVVLIGSLFVMLAARITWDQLGVLGLGSFLFLSALIFVVRPAAVVASCAGLGMSMREQMFLSMMAPRGIVAAAVSSLFALRLSGAGVRQAEDLAPVVFLVIVGTVLFYGLLAGPFARRVGLASKSQEGVLILGAHPLARAIGETLSALDVRVVLIDSNRANIAAARLAGLEGYQASIRSEYVVEHVPLDGIGRLLAMVSNDEVNALAALRFQTLFGRAEVYQVAPATLARAGTKEKDRMASENAARILFGNEHTYAELERRFDAGAEIRRTNITEEFGYEDYLERFGDAAVPMFLLRKNGSVRVFTEDLQPTPEPGDRLISMVHEPAGDAGVPPKGAEPGSLLASSDQKLPGTPSSSAGTSGG